MKIVVIGGTGLIGSKLVDKLRKDGHEPLAAAPGGKSPSARRDLLGEHALVSRAHELDGEPVGPPLVVDDGVADREGRVGLVASPRGPR